ncbi:Major Facilitator Superfamily protein [Paenibacillus tianmuensis]|uniref:Major Facilitator Superfamily protein n=1 Tax=Paenibacillus tianmuensis TaxID=624147 RepID=A0A1G4TRU0_9BACL|nr:MFS transporter [Paenibacillus tianmuensis]SCW84122.1 Major Facilitator Superfamily protein [Paenibacillus tianmuensis]
MEQGESKASIFDARYRALTIGIILAVTTVAFEGLAITTIAPDMAQHLNGISLYGWIFSAFLLTQILGTMVIGQQIGKIGVYRSFSLSIVIFVAGILIAATSVNMPMLIAGRAFQGFGAGAIVTCVYYSITLSYPDALRTKILAAFSSAYILPALIGPYIAGLLAEYVSWRFVFWLVLPLIVLAVLLTLPSFRKLQTESAPAKKSGRKEGYAVLLTVGTGLLLSGLGFVSDWKGIALALIGLIIMVRPLQQLLPAGTFSVKKGLPATIVSRGLYVACYVATESYVVLALTKVKGLPADLAGLIVAAGALSWSTAAWLQSKLDEKDSGRGRKKRVTAGIGFMIVGVSLVITAVGVESGGIWFAVISQIFTGFGIGLANPTTGAIALQHARSGEEGEISAYLQFVDAFFPGVSIGIGGALIAVSEHFSQGIFMGIMLALLAQLLFIVLSFLISFRIAKRAD